MASGLGIEWALNPILNHSETLMAGLLLLGCKDLEGASAGAVTDSSSEDPSGKTATSIAASSGHKGLVGYLSEVALTSYLSSLTLEESELSKGSAAVQAEMAVNSISNGSLPTGENQLSFKDTLVAVRNAAQAAARIQNAFLAHSFRKRQEKEDDVTAACVDEFGISLGEIQNLSTTSKLVFGSAHEYSSAALSIQKKFRGWKCPWLNVRMHVNNIDGCLKSIAKLRMSLLKCNEGFQNQI